MLSTAVLRSVELCSAVLFYALGYYFSFGVYFVGDLEERKRENES